MWQWIHQDRRTEDGTQITREYIEELITQRSQQKVEQRGARLLTDKAALSELPFKTDEWLISEVLADAGETVVLEPADMRARIAARARALQQELGVTVRRKRPAARA